jgi:hypothetical protein
MNLTRLTRDMSSRERRALFALIKRFEEDAMALERSEILAEAERATTLEELITRVRERDQPAEERTRE